MKEVASHKSQLMSITLIRSSIHWCAQGSIHPLLFRLLDPRRPGQIPTLTHTHTHTGVNCHSLHQDTLHRCQTGHPEAYTQTCAHILLHTGILNRRPGIDCFSHLTHYKADPGAILFPYKHVFIASTSKYSYRTSDTQQEEASISFMHPLLCCRSL